MKDRTLAKRLEKLRTECKDERALRYICKVNALEEVGIPQRVNETELLRRIEENREHLKKPVYQRKCEIANLLPNGCDGDCYACSLKDKEKTCPCFLCGAFKGISGNKGASISKRALGVATGRQETGVEKYESGKVDFTDQAFNDYARVFGEETMHEIVYNGGPCFASQPISRSPLCRCREEEMKRLTEMVRKNTVTVIHAAGGAGKTTLAKALLSILPGEDFQYYQTVTFKKGEGFDEDLFIKEIKLSERGEKELEKFQEENPHKEAKEVKRDFIRDRLNKAFITPLFLLDDFSSVGEELFALEENYPRCKFLVTTQYVEGFLDRYADAVLPLSYFGKSQALEVFNAYRRGNAASEADEEEFLPIYDFCLGNAEVLSFAARMLDKRPLSRFAVFLKEKPFEAPNKQTGEKETANMAERLRRLFGFEEDFLPSLQEKIEPSHPAYKKAKALAVLSLTGSVPIEREGLLQFLLGEESCDADVDELLTLLEKKGFATPDGQGNFTMHPLKCQALLLNGMEAQYSQEVALFAYLLTNEKRIAVKYGVTKMTDVVIPDGITRIKAGAFSNELEKLLLFQESFFPELDKELFPDLSEEQYSEEDTVLFALKRLFIPSHVKEIENGAFSHAEIEELYMEPGLEKIGERAFSFCKIKTLEIPDSVEAIRGGAFVQLVKDRCLQSVSFGAGLARLGSRSAFTGVKEISVSKENRTFYSQGNCLVEKKTRTLVLGCAESEIPRGVSFIGENAFCACEDLTELSIPDGVRKIDENAFFGCCGLTTLFLPATLVSFSPKQKFRSLCDVYFAGTEKDFEERDIVIKSKRPLRFHFLPV